MNLDFAASVINGSNGRNRVDSDIRRIDKKEADLLFSNDVSRKNQHRPYRTYGSDHLKFLQAYVLLTAKQVQADLLEPVLLSLHLCCFVVLNVCQ